MDKIVVYCGTRNLYDTMVVAAKSLLSHTAIDKIYFFIEDDSFPCFIPSIIETRNVSGQQWFNTSGANHISAWPYMAFIRLAAAKLLPDIQQILYLDTDTLVLKNISDILDTNLGTYTFGMVREDLNEIQLELCKALAVSGNKSISIWQSDNPRPTYCTHPYYNSGVMLMNLSEMRRTHIDDQLIHEINNTVHPYPDQDAINLLCHDSILPLPQDCNVIRAISPDFPADQIRIKHFASDKPLWKSSLWQSYKRTPWDFVMNRQLMLKGT